MSTLWTPDGERPIRRAEPSGPGSGLGAPGATPPKPDPSPAPSSRLDERPDDDDAADSMTEAELEAFQRQMAETPAEVVVTNHAVGLFNLARLHLSLDPAQLDQARLAIDAFAVLVEGLRGRLGPDEPALVEGLRQLRMAFVQISSAQKG